MLNSQLWKTWIHSDQKIWANTGRRNWMHWYHLLSRHCFIRRNFGWWITGTWKRATDVFPLRGNFSHGLHRSTRIFCLRQKEISHESTLKSTNEYNVVFISWLFVCFRGHLILVNLCYLPAGKGRSVALYFSCTLVHFVATPFLPKANNYQWLPRKNPAGRRGIKFRGHRTFGFHRSGKNGHGHWT